jgi:sugar O-acyltransferase (sialic acid O-acetyltransferase NeuD family)
MGGLAIFGGSGHGKVVAEAAIEAGWKSVEFFDDGWPLKSKNGSWDILGNMDVLLSRLNDFDGVIVAIGDCNIRWEKHQILKSKKACLISIVHPCAHVSGSAIVGAGSIVVAGAIVNADATIGEACIINTNATIDHDCNINHAVHIGPGANLSGNIAVGSWSWVGTGASIKHGIIIGANVIIGVGSAVVSNIADNQVVMGNPAKPRFNNA